MSSLLYLVLFATSLCIKSPLFPPGVHSNLHSSPLPTACDERTSNYSCIANNSSNGRVLQQIVGSHDTCFLINLSIQNKTFRVQIDTGSSDTALPHTSLNGYVGPTLAFSIPKGQESSQYNAYGDSSWWKGYLTRMKVGLGGDEVTSDNVPIALMTSQSTKPPFANGLAYEGLLGLAFPSLAATKSSPRTVTDALYDSGAIGNNEIAFHGCPFSKSNSSYIDIGNDAPYSACGGLKVRVQIENPDFYNLDVIEIGFNGTSQPLASNFQVRHLYILDSCTANILLPSSHFQTFVKQIYSSDAFSSDIQNSGYLMGWLSGNYLLKFEESELEWDLLPTLSFTFSSGMTVYENVTLEIGPRQYIQQVTSDNFWTFMVDNFGSNDLAVLGYPFFTSYHIVFDRSNGSLIFSPGCGCEESKDKYPLIYTNGHANKCTRNNSDLNSTVSWSCSTLANLQNAIAVRSYTPPSSSSFDVIASLSWVTFILVFVFA